MSEFPEFMKHPANRIARLDQATPGVDGYVFDGIHGSQMALWTCTQTANSASHVHDYGEFGVRRAVGAQTSDLLMLVARQGGLPVLAGLGGGLACTLAVRRVLASRLYGIEAADPATMASVSSCWPSPSSRSRYLPGAPPASIGDRSARRVR